MNPTRMNEVLFRCFGLAIFSAIPIQVGMRVEALRNRPTIIHQKDPPQSPIRHIAMAARKASQK